MVARRRTLPSSSAGTQLWPAAHIACAVAVVLFAVFGWAGARAQPGRLPVLFAGPEGLEGVVDAEPIEHGDWSAETPADVLKTSILYARWRGNASCSQVTAPDGAIVARVREIVHPARVDGLAEALGSSARIAPRIVFRFENPDGTPLFFVDFAEMEEVGPAATSGLSIYRSCVVVRPDGRVVGRTGFDFSDHPYGEFWDQFPRGLDDELHQRYGYFYDVRRGVLRCAKVSINIPQAVNHAANYSSFVDVHGTAFAQIDRNSGVLWERRIVRFKERVPDDLRMIALASLVIEESDRRAAVLTPDPAAAEPYPGFRDVHTDHYRRLRAATDVLAG
ncbi:hypothetical protein AB0L25_26640 [Spirillospora sp. NPDC052242]